ncbi:MAG: efflux RND transporter periplasmic adaptor subunit [Cyanobacteria bacterium]|nr:efflux RND transporter periplasmic adaptor subunit [Cyanobacteriota bacterium]
MSPINQPRIGRHFFFERMRAFVLSCALLCGGVQGFVVSPVALAHSGHGDEFVQNGEVGQVKVSPEQDQLLGITTAAPQSDPNGQLTLPTVAIVEANGKSLVFVRSGNTYDPVFVVLGAVTGDRTVVREGVSADEQVVVSGALSLYAESQKKDRVPVQTSPADTAGAKPAQADEQSAQDSAPAWLLPGGVGVAVLVILALGLGIRSRASGSKQG